MRLLVAVLALAAVIAAQAQAQTGSAKLCAPAEVRSAVTRFVAAFNAGQGARSFAREPDFRWYSTDAPGKRFLPIASDRGSLPRYFARRHARGERLALTSMQVNSNTDAQPKPYGNFDYRLVRSADDLPATDYRGKGALHCYRSRPDELIVWSMARAMPVAPLP
jgi:hypothetical protein